MKSFNSIKELKSYLSKNKNNISRRFEDYILYEHKYLIRLKEIDFKKVNNKSDLINYSIPHNKFCFGEKFDFNKEIDGILFVKSKGRIDKYLFFLPIAPPFITNILENLSSLARLKKKSKVIFIVIILPVLIFMLFQNLDLVANFIPDENIDLRRNAEWVIAIGKLDYENTDCKSISKELDGAITASLQAKMERSYPDMDISIFSPDEVETINSRKKLDNVGEKFNADLIVYGEINQDFYNESFHIQYYYYFPEKNFSDILNLYSNNRLGSDITITPAKGLYKNVLLVPIVNRLSFLTDFSRVLILYYDEDFDKAYEGLSKLLTNYQEISDDSWKSIIYVLMGNTKVYLGNISDGEEDYQKALLFEGSNTRANLGLAGIYFTKAFDALILGSEEDYKFSSAQADDFLTKASEGLNPENYLEVIKYDYYTAFQELINGLYLKDIDLIVDSKNEFELLIDNRIDTHLSYDEKVIIGHSYLKVGIITLYLNEEEAQKIADEYFLYATKYLSTNLIPKKIMDSILNRED